MEDVGKRKEDILGVGGILEDAWERNDSGVGL